MKLTNFVKNLTTKFVPAFVIALALFCSIAPKYYLAPVVYASGSSDTSVAGKIVDYINTMSGAIYKSASSGTDVIKSIPSTIWNNLMNKVTEGINGGGVYQDENGDYHFTNEFMNEYYAILSSNSSNDVHVCSDFSSFDNGINNGYTNASYSSAVAGINSEALLKGSQSGYIGYMLSSDVYTDSNNRINTEFWAYAIPEEFAYFYCNGNSAPYNLIASKIDGSMLSSNKLKVWGCRCVYTPSSDSYSNTIFSYDSTSSFPAYSYSLVSCLFPNTSFNYIQQSTKDALFQGFPNYGAFSVTSGSWGTVNVSSVSIFASDAVIIAKSNSAGQTYINQVNNEYIDYFYVNNNDLTISNTIINNNNWNNIYYNYVTNVNNEYNQGSNLTKKDIQKIMKKYNDEILLAIKNGIENLEEQFGSVIKWLDKISGQIDDIKAYLQEILDSLDDTEIVVTNVNTGPAQTFTSSHIYMSTEDGNAHSTNGKLYYDSSSATKYYSVFNIKDVPTFKLTTSGTSRTRILLSNYEPLNYQSDLNGSTEKVISGVSCDLLDNNVTDYEVNNSSNVSYLYVYEGTTDGDVTISYDVEEVVSGGGEGGGSCAWTEQDVNRAMQILERFYLYSDDYKTYLHDIDNNTDGLEGKLDLVKNAITSLYNLLSAWQSNINLLPSMAGDIDGIGANVSDMSVDLARCVAGLQNVVDAINGLGRTTYNPNNPIIDPDVIDLIDNMTDEDWLNLFNPLDALMVVLEGAAPFCYFVLVGTIISQLSAQPVAPSWDGNIHLASHNSYLNIFKITPINMNRNSFINI